MNTDLYLDPNSHDLVITADGVRFASTTEESAAQRIKIRLLVFREEWILDLREGVPYFQEILTKTSKQVVDAIFKAKILEDPLVDKISYFTSSINTATRKYTLSFEALLTDGETSTVNLTVGV